MGRAVKPGARGLFVVGLALSLVVEAPVRAQQGAVLHEYVPYDPSAESELGVVTTEGGFDVEKLTSSGKITAPDPGRPIGEKTPLYGGKSPVGDKFVPDRDTRRVDHLTYDDPFRPRLAPFKRLQAFDSVDSDYSLTLSTHTRTRVAVGIERLKGVASYEPSDVFYADLALELRAGDPIRIPSAVGGNVVKRAHLTPSVGYRLERDVADNLFIVADGGGRARLVLELEAARKSFGGDFAATDWSDLARVPPHPLPASVQKAADDFIAKDLAIDKAKTSPRDAIAQLVRYFREFKESEDPPPSSGDIYLDLVRSKKGVCRHRAFGFMVTALALKIPARFIENEAHAWVEAFDGALWHRIDLGGAGRTLDDKTEKAEKEQPPYAPPEDPYAWPPGATKGTDLLPPSTAPAPAPTGTGAASPPPSPAPATPSGSATPPSAPPSKLTLMLPGAPTEDTFETLRGTPFVVKGHVADSTGAPCKRVLVELKLSSNTAGEIAIGKLPTNDDGDYEGKVAIPSSAKPADYTLVATTPGAGGCGQGSSE
jgi:transglutaminase-like putative cysteine protease